MLIIGGCGTGSVISDADPSVGPVDSNECAVDIVNGSELPMAVTVYAREVQNVGTLRPGGLLRYQEECTARTWSVVGVPKRTPGKEPERQPTISTTQGLPVTRQAEVWPGHVARVVL